MDVDPFEEARDSRRVALIKQIAGRVDPDDMVEPGFWAFAWLGELSQVEIFVKIFAASSENLQRQNYESPGWTSALRVCEILRPLKRGLQNNRHVTRVHPRSHQESRRSQRGEPLHSPTQTETTGQAADEAGFPAVTTPSKPEAESASRIPQHAPEPLAVDHPTTPVTPGPNSPDPKTYS
jgi:hypothetical protein